MDVEIGANCDDQPCQQFIMMLRCSVRIRPSDFAMEDNQSVNDRLRRNKSNRIECKGKTPVRFPSWLLASKIRNSREQSLVVVEL
ncbi:MAG: hypothetical protein A2Y76_15120 [Planctomycetes bacterium RBG_13_60_9]|nr:MAG: hypothetical protein A2Y76_15120 [Planctomycetes bacterium RBG_13_60_9]